MCHRNLLAFKGNCQALATGFCTALSQFHPLKNFWPPPLSGHKYVQLPYENMVSGGSLPKNQVFPLCFMVFPGCHPQLPGGRSQRDRDQQFQGQGGGSVAQRPLGERPHRDNFDAVDDMGCIWYSSNRW